MNRREKQMGILEVLCLILIVGNASVSLKLTEVIAWPWVVVLLPFIVFLAIIFLAFLFATG